MGVMIDGVWHAEEPVSGSAIGLPRTVRPERMTATADSRPRRGATTFMLRSVVHGPTAL